MADIYVWAFTAALNPVLLGATTVMLLLDHPKRLLLGYLLGAMMTSITLGLVIVFAVDGSSGGTSTAQNTLSPAADLALGGILLVVAYLIRPGRVPREEGRIADRRRRRQEAKKQKHATLADRPQQGNGADHVRRRGAPDVAGRLLPDRPEPHRRPERKHYGDDCSRAQLQPDHAAAPRAAPDRLRGCARLDAEDRRSVPSLVQQQLQALSCRLFGGVGLLLIVRGVIELL